MAFDVRKVVAVNLVVAMMLGMPLSGNAGFLGDDIASSGGSTGIKSSLLSDVQEINELITILKNKNFRVNFINT